MVCDHHQSFRKIRLQPSIFCLLQLSSYASIATHSDGGGAEPCCSRGYEQTEGLLGKGHICVVVILVDAIDRRAKKLSCMDTEDDRVDPRCEQ